VRQLLPGRAGAGNADRARPPDPGQRRTRWSRTRRVRRIGPSADDWPAGCPHHWRRPRPSSPG